MAKDGKHLPEKNQPSKKLQGHLRLHWKQHRPTDVTTNQEPTKQAGQVQLQQEKA